MAAMVIGWLVPPVAKVGGRAGDAIQPPENDGLYSDAEVRMLANHDLDTPPAEGASSPLAYPCLDVVPNGETRPLPHVLAALGLKESRLRNPRSRPDDFVLFVAWQVSPSYDLVCMIALNDPDNAAGDQPKVYGVRIIRRNAGATNW
jgi:hypothetical protein